MGVSQFGPSQPFSQVQTFGKVQFPSLKHGVSHKGIEQSLPDQPSAHKHLFGPTHVPLLKQPRIT